MNAKLNCNFMAGADGVRQLDDLSPRVATVEGNRDVQPGHQFNTMKDYEERPEMCSRDSHTYAENGICTNCGAIKPPTKHQQHTPGPWEYGSTDGWGLSLDVWESKTARTLFKGISTLPKEEQEANARLIAAAPMMLETLEWIGRQQNLFFTECDQAEKILQRVLEAVRAATKVPLLEQ